MVVNHFCRGIFMVDTNISMGNDYVMPIQNHNYEFLKWFMEWLITALDMASAESVSQIKGGFDRNHLRHQRPYHIWFHVLVSAVGFSLEILLITGRELRSLAQITFFVFLVVQGGTLLLGPEFVAFWSGATIFWEKRWKGGLFRNASPKFKTLVKGNASPSHQSHQLFVRFLKWCPTSECQSYF